MNTSDENLIDYEGEIGGSLKINYGGTINTKKEEEDKNPDKPPPIVNPFLMQSMMFLIGITCLLPWYFFIQADEYWMYKFRNVSAENTTSTDKTELQVNFFNYLPIVSKVPYVLFLFVNTMIADRIRPQWRMLYPLVIVMLLFIVVTSLVKVNTDDNQDTFFTVMICMIIAINVACGFLQGAGTGIAGAFPKVYMGYYVKGMALGGILASLVQIISIAASGSAIQSALMYFIAAVIILIITIIVFVLVIRTEYYQFYMSKQLSAKASKNTPRKWSTYLAIFKQIKIYAISVTLIFWISLSVIPTLVVRVTSNSTEQTIWTGRLFLPLACFFLFNVCDLVGRILAMQFPIPPERSYVTLASCVVRVVFVPLLMLCNAHPRHHLPVVFDNDMYFIMIIFLFALSNGYLCNVVLTQATKIVDEEHQEISRAQMAFFLGCGLALGSLTSYGLVELL